jgi:hypothetical protein
MVEVKSMSDKFKNTTTIALVIIGIIVIILSLQTSSMNKQKSNPVIEQPKEEVAKSEIKENVNNEPPLKIEQLPLDIKFREPDSIGNVYMDATYTNNSNKNIVGYNTTVLIKDTNKTTYLMTYNTVLPGETSPKFNTIGPKTKNMDDVQILKYEITIANNDGTKTNIEYDNKLKQYKWTQSK